MTISMCVENHESGECDFLPVCPSSTFRGTWKRVIEELDLEMMPHLPALMVGDAYELKFIREVDEMIRWVHTRMDTDDMPYWPIMLERLERIRKTVTSTDLKKFSISFG